MDYVYRWATLHEIASTDCLFTQLLSVSWSDSVLEPGKKIAMLSHHVVDEDGVPMSRFDLVIYMNDESTRD